MALNVPELRFPEFSREWEEKKLENIAKVNDGTHFTPNYQDTGVPFFSVETVASNVNPKFISNEEHETLIKRCNPKKGDILLTRIGTLAESKLVDWNYEFSIYVSLALVKSKKLIHPAYLNQFFKTEKYKKDFLRKSLLLATPKKINVADLKKTNITFPSIPEQEKIASFLSKVDEKIEKLEKTQDLWETYKKGMMQQIFSQELRFKDENGEDYPNWEEKRLGEIMIEAKLGGNYENSESNEGYPLIKMGNLGRGVINLDKLQYLPESEIFNQDDILKEGDLLFNTRNTLELVGKVSIWRNELPFALYNSNLMRMRFNNYIESSNKFMNYLFNTRKSINQLRSFATGTTSVAAIYGRDLKHLKVQFPSVNEQEKIASLISKIDEKIEIIEKELKTVKNFKKGLLQQMFC